MNIEFCFPSLAVVSRSGHLPESGYAIGIVAVIDLDFSEPIQRARCDRKMRCVIFNAKGGGRSHWNIFILSGKMLFEPMIEENPLLGTRTMIGVHIGGHTPFLVREQIHRSVNSLEGRMKIIR